MGQQPFLGVNGNWEKLLTEDEKFVTLSTRIYSLTILAKALNLVFSLQDIKIFPKKEISVRNLKNKSNDNNFHR
jgi:hypothetical protein